MFGKTCFEVGDMMKYLKYILISIISMLFLLPGRVCAKEKVTLYLFHGNTCVHCKAAWEYLDTIKSDYPSVDFVGYEIFEDTSNEELLTKVRKILGSDSRGVPFFVIGERYLTGFGDYRKEDVIDALDYYMVNYDEYDDIVAKVILGEFSEHEDDEKLKEVHPVNMLQVKKEKTYKKIVVYGIGSILLILLLIILRKKW